MISANLILASTMALAQTASPTNDAKPIRTAKRAGSQEEDLPLRREYRYEGNFRFRYMGVPSSIMDIWFFDNDDDGAFTTYYVTENGETHPLVNS